ncbi:flavodoxin family protein [uncultured Anaeromusa sp.]|uniref:flavodoxin family protein n=1 Tax=uncultured Anaeromusa sp. TaxID=673273 RepID=UPI0029C7E62D|nr:flavodoxin family protein [uncultured Anaeromusa sp.]
MKVVGINGSPRKEGNTSIIIKEVFKELEKNGIETELIQLGGLPVRACMACMKCFEMKNGKCVIQNDVFNDVIDKMRKADGVLLGSPVYSADVTPEMKALLDRGALVSHANGGALLNHKVAGSVTAVRRSGALHAFDTMNHFLHITESFLVGASYWNMVHGLEPGDVLHDEEGMKNMQVLGQNMAWLLKRLNG